MFIVILHLVIALCWMLREFSDCNFPAEGKWKDFNQLLDPYMNIMRDGNVGFTYKEIVHLVLFISQSIAGDVEVCVCVCVCVCVHVTVGFFVGMLQLH